MLDWAHKYSDRACGLLPSPIRAMAKQAGLPGVISFAPGAPSAPHFPYDAIAQAAAEIMGDAALRAQALQYGASEGYQPLREFIAELLGTSNAPVISDEVIITSGSQQALEFIGKIFLNKGDRIVVTSPTYSGALQAFGLFEPVVIGVAISENGLDLARLEAQFIAGAKFFYVMPDHGNPNGTVLPLEQRQAILKLARQYSVIIIEDQAYDQLQLTGTPLPTLLSLDRADGLPNSVIYLGTFSKSLNPGLRVGWIVAPVPVIEKLTLIKQASDLNSGMLNQIVTDRVARRVLQTHGQVLRDYYRDQRDAMLEALEQNMPDTVIWTKPRGGMFIWLTLPIEMDAALFQKTVFEEEKVIFVPGESFHADHSGKNTLRLSYSLQSAAKISVGIAGLARVIKKRAPN